MCVAYIFVILFDFVLVCVGNFISTFIFMFIVIVFIVLDPFLFLFLYFVFFLFLYCLFIFIFITFSLLGGVVLPCILNVCAAHLFKLIYLHHHFLV